MTLYLAYETKPGDRWDLIAYKMYGDARRYPAILDANRGQFVSDPLRPIPPVLDAGIMLRIPVLDAPATGVSAPPWRQS